MIARYFGGKAQLFIAVLRAEDAPEQPVDLLDPRRLESLIERTGNRGPGPILQAAIRPYDNPEVLTAAFIGVILGRHVRTFEHLSSATTEQLLALMQGLLRTR